MKNVIIVIVLIGIGYWGFGYLQNAGNNTPLSPNEFETLVVENSASLNESQVFYESWDRYTNVEQGISFDLPSGLVVESELSNMNPYNRHSISFAYPKQDPRNYNGGRFNLSAWNREDVPSNFIQGHEDYLMNEKAVDEPLSKTVISGEQGISVVFIKEVSYPTITPAGGVSRKSEALKSIEATLLFESDGHAYQVFWDCSAKYACFNDDIIRTFVDSIRFE